MKAMITKGKSNINAAKTALMLCMYFVVSSAHAALPATAPPTNAAADGDYIGLIKGYAYDIAIVIGLILGTVAFLSVSSNMIGVYKEIGAGKKTWGDMGMHGGMGVLLLVFVVFLITEASSVLF